METGGVLDTEISDDFKRLVVKEVSRSLEITKDVIEFVLAQLPEKEKEDNPVVVAENVIASVAKKYPALFDLKLEKNYSNSNRNIDIGIVSSRLNNAAYSTSFKSLQELYNSCLSEFDDDDVIPIRTNLGALLDIYFSFRCNYDPEYISSLYSSEERLALLINSIRDRERALLLLQEIGNFIEEKMKDMDEIYVSDS